jgi:hypothetical protein
LQTDAIFDGRDVLGEVEVSGVVYRIEQSGLNQREVIRRSDGCRVGTLRGSPTTMWRLEAERIDNELLRSIVRAAVEDGVLVDLLTD